MTTTPTDLIERLQLKAHPEGGYFRESYRSDGEVDAGPGFEGKRAWSTGIYFLLTADRFSAFHRIRQDEMWHFYEGAPLELHLISPAGGHSLVRMGRDLGAGEFLQFVVPAGHWFAATVVEGGDHSLVGCTVSPGFDFRDFELADRHELLAIFPQHAAIITALTRK